MTGDYGALRGQVCPGLRGLTAHRIHLVVTDDDGFVTPRIGTTSPHVAVPGA